MARKWMKYKVSDQDLTKTLNIHTGDGWEVFSVERVVDAMYGQYEVLLWKEEQTWNLKSG